MCIGKFSAQFNLIQSLFGQFSGLTISSELLT